MFCSTQCKCLALGVICPADLPICVIKCPLHALRDSHNQISHTSGGWIMNTSPWNKNRIIGQKKPLQISQIWGIRIRLELEGKTRDLALFNIALDSKLRGCDLVKLKVSDVAYSGSVSSRATVLQQKTGSPVQFELTKGTREAVAALIKLGNLHSKDYLFKSRVGSCQHISTRQYNRIFHGWIAKLGLEDSLYSTHSMRRSKPYLIYKKSKRAVVSYC